MLSRWSKPRAAVYSSTPNFPLEMKWIDPYHPCVLAQELNTERAPGFLEQISTCLVCVSPEGADWRESGQIRCVSSWSCRNRNQIYLRPRSPKTSYLAAWQCTQLGKQATCERMWLCLQALVLLEADHRVVPFPSHSLTHNSSEKQAEEGVITLQHQTLPNISSQLPTTDGRSSSKMQLRDSPITAKWTTPPLNVLLQQQLYQ